MNQNHEHAFLYYRSPEDIRNQEFSHRMRGIDADEVYEFLDLLADQVSSSEVERTETLRDNERLRRENEQYRAEVERLRGELQSAQQQRPAASYEDDHSRASALLTQAQQVADQLVEEAVQHARELMASARTQQRPVRSGWGSDPRTDHGRDADTSWRSDGETGRAADTENDRWRDSEKRYDWGIPQAPPPPPARDYAEPASSTYGSYPPAQPPAQPSRHDDEPPPQKSSGYERTFTYRRRTGD